MATEAKCIKPRRLVFPNEESTTTNDLVSYTKALPSYLAGTSESKHEMTTGQKEQKEQKKDWWKKYIQKEEGERKCWETLECTGKRYVRHHPLIDYNYIETKEVSENDEESAKRVKELEKLLEKTNTFPEIKEVKRSQQEGKSSKRQNKLVPNT